MTGESTLPTEREVTPTVWVVWCGRHQHYVKFTGVTGTTWSNDQSEARIYDTKPAARKAAESASWAGHEAVPWAIADPRSRDGEKV